MEKSKRKAPRSIRIHPEYEAWVIAKAKEGDRSVNEQIGRLIRLAMEAEQKEKQAGI